MSEQTANAFGIACLRSSRARTEAAMGAIFSLREQLATENGRETGHTDSAYQNIKGILFDLFEGAYQQGYCTGEDVTSMRLATEEQA